MEPIKKTTVAAIKTKLFTVFVVSFFKLMTYYILQASMSCFR